MELIKQTLYALDEPSRTRTVPMRVLAVGPSRSGTGSLRAALLQLGYHHTYHGFDVILHPEDDITWHKLRLKREKVGPRGTKQLTAADFDTVIGHCAAIADHVAAAFAPELIAAYPEAKVILNIRKDVDAWHKSVMETLILLQSSWLFWLRSWFCAELFWVHEGFFRGNWHTFYRGSFESNSRKVLEEHCRTVKHLVPPGQLLEWDVHDGWEPLCTFLDQPVPSTPFPTLNTARRYKQLYKDRVAHADRNIGKCILGLMAVVCLLWILV